MATCSNILAEIIPWKEEPGGLQSMGSQRVRHKWSDWAHILFKIHVLKLWDHRNVKEII